MPSGEHGKTQPHCPACGGFAHAGPCKLGNKRRAATFEQLSKRLAISAPRPATHPPIREISASEAQPFTPGEIAALRDFLRGYSPLDLMSIPEASRRSGISQKAIYLWIKLGLIPVYGRRRIFRVSWSSLFPVTTYHAIPEDLPDIK